MTYFWIRTIAGILVVATISTLIPSNLLKALIEIPLSYYQEKKKNK